MQSVRLPTGTSVCVCDPQSVATDLISLGSRGFEMLKIRTPSQAPGSDAIVSSALQPAFVCGSSTDAKSSLPHTETSNWPPLQGSKATCLALAGFEMSITRKPLYVPAYAYLPWKARSDCAAASTLGTFFSSLILALCTSCAPAVAGRAKAPTASMGAISHRSTRFVESISPHLPNEGEGRS